MGDARLIHEPAALEAALFRLHGAKRLALDTEFMRERTYHPQLCLVHPGSCSLIAHVRDDDHLLRGYIQ